MIRNDKQVVGASAVKAQLDRILRSSDFEASERNRRFLSFLVGETLSGNAAQIKAYTIATSVFGRGQDFDPQLDSIVRIEAGRLRRSLQNYYLRAGANDLVRIDIPKGSYVPTFESVDALAPKVAPKFKKFGNQCGPTVFVGPFEEEGDQTAYPNFTHGLRRQVIVGLTRFTNLVVFGPSATFGSGAELDVDGLRSEGVADFILTAGTSLSATHFRMGVLLIDARDGQYLWGETFKRRLKPGDILELRDEVADRVTRALAQPYGILFSKARDTDGDHPENMSSYDCVVYFHSYWRTYDHEMFERVRAGLERAIVADPGYAEAFACLSQIYANAARFGHDVSGDTDKPLQRALELAHRAIELAPNSSRGHHALGLALWFNGNVSGSLEALETGLALNPNDSEIMADLGLRHIMLTDWDQGVPLIQESYARNPAQPGAYRIGLALYHLAHGHLEAAFDEARMIDAPHVVYGHLVTAAAAALLGRSADANTSMQALLAIDAEYFNHLVEDLRARNLHPDLISLLLDALGAHGYLGPDMGGEKNTIEKKLRRRRA